MEIGIDIEKISRIKRAHRRFGDRFLERIFSKREIDYCFALKYPYASLTGRFCAKEAVIKVFSGRVHFRQIEIVNDKSGKPYVLINGRRANVKVSISHTEDYAVAVAVLI